MKTDQDTPTDKEKEITETIEEIAPDDTSQSSGEEQFMVTTNSDVSCPNCGFESMVKLLGCHYLCRNCGSERTCSDL